MTPPRLKASTASRLQRLVERAMTFAVEEYDDDAAVRRLVWLAQGDHAVLDRACDVCLSYTEVDLAIRGQAIGVLARSATATFLSRLGRPATREFHGAPGGGTVDRTPAQEVDGVRRAQPDS